MATNNNINYGPAAIPETVQTPVLGNNIDRAPAPVAPGAGIGIVPVVTAPVIPVVEQPVINPPIVTRTTTAVIPVVEQSVEVVANVTAEATVAAATQQRYITILANGVVVTNNAATLDFEGSGFTIANLGTNGATITMSAAGYGNSNVVTLLSAFGSNTVSTTGNVTAGYVFGNGSQLTGLPATYGNANVVANLAALGSNPISTTGNVTGGNIMGGANVNATTHTGTTVLVSANVTGGNILTGGLISATSTIISAANITGGNLLTGGLISATGNVTGGNVLTGGLISATGNISGNYFIGNGSQLTGIVSSYGNANVVANLAALGSNPISTTGNVTGGNVLTGGLVSATGNVFGNFFIGNGSQLTGLPATYGNANVATFLAAYGSNTVSTTGNITAGNLIGNISITGNVQGTTANVTLVAGIYNTVFDNTGNLTLPGNTFAVNYANNTPVPVVTRVESSWTVPVGNSTQSFTVPINNMYQLWVNSNIPNGIIVWNATVSVTNTNVPVIGQQFAWNYEGGGNILMLTSIPAQIIGTAGVIANAQPAVANTNVFSFGINNTSGNAVTVNYGWIQIS